MSRLQAGALEISAAPVGLEEVLPAALQSLGARDGAVRARRPRDPAARARRSRAARAGARERVDNAIRFSPPGTPARVTAGDVDGVRRRARRRPRTRRPAGERERIFLPFQRLGDAGRARASGLGLAVAKGFVEAMGGEIEAEDTPGGGLTIVVRLQAAAVTRILVVDDEPQILRALATNLRARGYDVDARADRRGRR